MGFADLGRDAEIGKWAAEWKGKGIETMSVFSWFRVGMRHVISQ
jgi:hypothetical protein